MALELGALSIHKRRTEGQRAQGQAALELAVLLPMLLLLLLSIMELGRAVLIYSEITNAAREGARHGMAHPGDVDPIATAAFAKIFIAPDAEVTVEVSYDNGSPTPVPVTTPVFGDRVVVTVTHDLTFFTPMIADTMGPLSIRTVSRRTILGGG